MGKRTKRRMARAFNKSIQCPTLLPNAMVLKKNFPNQEDNKGK